MSPWPSRLVILGAALFFAGWGLVLAPGNEGASDEGLPLVALLGGLMLYACFPVFLLAGAWALITRMRRRLR